MKSIINDLLSFTRAIARVEKLLNLEPTSAVNNGRRGEHEKKNLSSFKS